MGINIPISVGGYSRILPYYMIEKGLKRINSIEGKPFIFYLHPWELDVDQSRIVSISMLSKFRYYVNLDRPETKFKRLLRDFNFSPIKDLLKTDFHTQETLQVHRR